MTGRSGLTEGERGDSRGYGRLLLVAVLVLAIAATAVLVLSNDARFLRLGVLAALWAALVGAFLAVKYRREAAASEDEVADLQAVYELELEREVAARREYELEIEAETRRRVEEESREDLEALRGELRALRENLEALLGGEVLVERVALRAESTRMRSLSDQSRLLAVGEDRIIAKEDRKPITVGSVRKETPADKSPATELIERIPHEPLRAKEQAPRRPEPSRPEATRQPSRSNAQTEALSRSAAAGQARREPQRPAQPAATQFVNRPAAAKAAEPRPAERRPEARPPETRQPEPRKPAAGVPNVVGMRVQPSQALSQPMRAPDAREPRRAEPPRAPQQQPQQQPQRPEPAAATMAMRLNPEMKQQAPSRQPATAPVDAAGRRRRPEAANEATQMSPRPTPAETSGRRRRPEPAQQAAAAPPPEVDGPVWDPELGDWVPNSLELPIPVRTAPPVAPPPGPVPSAPPPPVTPPPVVDTGAHAAGKSVSELLASLGQEESRGRRRRRSED
ncbi:DUF6779 domain-containing protein [Kutzneria chonburiensis]|uniref:DUF6779 domain-containing protein n=1 Tax=Kutzneria chonburiensis TaxID=1483604 RepID=A0ABV6N2F4_9PSEU|nr:DUF6779 domain-containing protein [Kutzneria chonburiensis]